MEPENEIDKVLAEAAERIRREGYEAGWRAALAAVNKALEEVSGQADGPTLANGTGAAVSQTRPAAVSSSVTVGSTPWYVLQAVTKRPGMSGADIVSAVQEGGHKVSEGSIRTSIGRLKSRKLIVARHGKWFPA